MLLASTSKHAKYQYSASSHIVSGPVPSSKFDMDLGLILLSSYRTFFYVLSAELGKLFSNATSVYLVR
jgi:hypothetical protein